MELVIEISWLQLCLLILLIIIAILLQLDNKSKKNPISNNHQKIKQTINLNKIIKNTKFDYNTNIYKFNNHTPSREIFSKKIQNKQSEISFIKKIDEKYNFENEDDYLNSIFKKNKDLSIQLNN